MGLAQEGLPSNVVASAQCLANVANLLNTRDTELSRWVGFLFFFYLLWDFGFYIKGVVDLASL